jgi:CTP:molybdopterin cytidylyltransferase MocA
MNIVVPMAGTGTIIEGGLRKPRYLVEVLGKPLFTWAIDGARQSDCLYFVVKRRDYEQYDLARVIRKYVRCKAKVALLDEVTNGQAESALEARRHLDNDDPLIVLNPNQISNCDFDRVMDTVEVDNCSGAIVVAKEIICGDPIFYVSIRQNTEIDDFEVNYVTHKPVKDCISVAGIYYWKFGFEFIRFIRQMIKKKHKHNDRYYVAPVFNEAVMDNRVLKVCSVESSAFIQRRSHIETFEEYRQSLGK